MSSHSSNVQQSSQGWTIRHPFRGFLNQNWLISILALLLFQEMHALFLFLCTQHPTGMPCAVHQDSNQVAGNCNTIAPHRGSMNRALMKRVPRHHPLQLHELGTRNATFCCHHRRQGSKGERGRQKEERGEGEKEGRGKRKGEGKEEERKREKRKEEKKEQRKEREKKEEGKKRQEQKESKAKQSKNKREQTEEKERKRRKNKRRRQKKSAPAPPKGIECRQKYES